MPLTEEDTEFLEAHFNGRWEETPDGLGVIIKDFVIPAGYQPEKSNLLIMIPNSYPGAQLDMFYFEPPISRKDGAQIEALANEEHFDKTWQRWSRHYEWNSEEDSLVSHIGFVTNQMQNEVGG